MREQRDLLRVACSPAGEIAADPMGGAPGRGAYLCPRPECLAAARQRRAFDRVFRRAVPAATVAALEESLRELIADRSPEG